MRTEGQRLGHGNKQQFTENITLKQKLERGERVRYASIRKRKALQTEGSD